MASRILTAVLGGLLVLGVSIAFAEEPQLTNQEVLKAWGQTQTEVDPISDSFSSPRTRGLQPLTDEELEQIDAGMAPEFPSGAEMYIPRDHPFRLVEVRFACGLSFCRN